MGAQARAQVHCRYRHEPGPEGQTQPTPPRGFSAAWRNSRGSIRDMGFREVDDASTFIENLQWNEALERNFAILPKSPRLARKSNQRGTLYAKPFEGSPFSKGRFRLQPGLVTGAPIR